VIHSLRANVVYDEGTEVRQHKVPEPVRSAAQGDTLGADAQGERLAEQDPRSRTPEHRVSRDVQYGKGDQDVSPSRLLRGSRAGIVGVELADESSDDSAACLEEGAEQERLSASDVLDRPHGGDDHGEGDSAEDRLDRWRVSGGTASSVGVRGLEVISLQYDERVVPAFSKKTGPY
jgi:hypothetical protein